MNMQHNDDIAAVERAIGYSFSNKKLLSQALTHRSFSNEQHDAPHNERLEFLGDAVLQFITTRELYMLYPEVSEGTLSVYRSLIVKTNFLTQVAENLRLTNYIRVSIGQKKELTASSGLFADAVEAIIGAIYLDGGIQATERFILQIVLPKDIQAYLVKTPKLDDKTVLQEHVQREISVTPRYLLLDETGPDHDKTFTVAVEIDGKIKAKGTGKSKREAEQQAAQKTLAMYVKNSQS